MSSELVKANTGITLTPSTQVKELTPHESNIFLAAQSPMIKDCKNGDVKKMLGVLLEKANIFLGQGKLVNPTDFKLMVIDPTAEYLFQSVPFLRLEELSLAIQYGSRGEFKKDGEALYISPEKVASWIKGYQEFKKPPVMAKMSKLHKVESPTLTEEQQREILVNGALSKFETFKANGSTDDPGNATYNFLDELGLIRFSTPEKKEMMAEVIKILQKEQERKRLKALAELDKVADSNAKKAMKELATISETMKSQYEKLHEQSGVSTVIRESKKAALNKYFKNLIIEGKELTEYLTHTNQKEK